MAIKDTNRFDIKKIEIQKRIDASKQALIADFHEIKDDLNPLHNIKNSFNDFIENMSDFNPFSDRTPDENYFSIQHTEQADAERVGFTISDNLRLDDNISKVIDILKPFAILTFLVWLKHDKINLKNYFIEGMILWSKNL